MAGNPEYPLELLSREPKIRARAVFPKTFVGFDGHFLGAPLLPGFMHVQTALDVLRKAGEPHLLKEVTVGKFTRPILPEAPVIVTLSRGEHANSYEVTVISSDEICSTFTIIVEAASHV